MRYTIEGGSPEFEEKLLALFAEHRDELTLTPDTTWTPARAEHLLRDAAPRAAEILRAVITAGGRIEADQLREDGKTLRGHTSGITQAVNRGALQGRWPHGMPAPIEPIYDPENRSFQRAIAYEMVPAILAAFTEAAQRIG
jgi:hypothetical protein